MNKTFFKIMDFVVSLALFIACMENCLRFRFFKKYSISSRFHVKKMSDEFLLFSLAQIFAVILFIIKKS